MILSLKNLFSDIWVCGTQSKKKIDGYEDLFYSSIYFDSKCWYIHGQFLKENISSSFPKSLIKKDVSFRTSLKEIDVEFNDISNKYMWSFFPWGYPIEPLSCWVFLSKTQAYHDRFIDFFSSAYGNQYIISTYNCVSNISNAIRSIILGDYAEQAYPIWDLNNSCQKSLFMITNLQLDEDFSIYPWWDSSGLTWIQTLKLTIKCPNVLQVYRISNRNSFMSMCMLDTQQPDTLIFVPETTNLEKLEKLLSKTEDYNNYSDLIHLQDILKATQWFYGVGRDFSDLGISLLAAQDSRLLQRFDILNQNKDYRLISCF
jgi:hypothetical protein